MNALIQTIRATEGATRDRSFESLHSHLSDAALLGVCDELEEFRRGAANLYERVRATLFLRAAFRFRLVESTEFRAVGAIPEDAFADLLERRFEAAVERVRRELHDRGPDRTLFSALAFAYHHLTFQTLTDQVRKSVRQSRGNQWMFRAGFAGEHPIRVVPEMLERPGGSSLYPILCERTPVRLDLSHSGWSDIFFLGMDFPGGARVINLSVDLGVYGRDEEIRPPIESFLRVITEPVLRLTSIDLGATKDIQSLDDLFNFGNDHLGLVKAGVIASGLIPPAFEGTGQPLERILGRVTAPGMGLEVVTRVRDIPKGSRLAVSTNLLASIISLLMRATGQTRRLTGELEEEERRLVASRAILGEWLGGSGGGWQDSGGIWPGIKVIEGVAAAPGDPEYGVSNGCLLPRHRVLRGDDLHPDAAERLQSALIPFHGGMAQDVGPILEMVTEKYLLRGAAEWQARTRLGEIFDAMLVALRDGDIRTLAGHATANFEGPLATIIPWVTNRFTEEVISRARSRFGEQFWGFQMMGGMSGGGMGVYVDPAREGDSRAVLLELLAETKSGLEDALPFAMDPVVYDFRLNQRGSVADLQTGAGASPETGGLLPGSYYALHLPQLVRGRAEDVAELRRTEVVQAAGTCDEAESRALLHSVVGNLFQADTSSSQEREGWDREASEIRTTNGFDEVQHERIREQMVAGRIGIAHNRLPIETAIEDVPSSDLLVTSATAAERGRAAMADGTVAVLSLAAGMGTRWTSGAGVVKALNPFARLGGRHRSFLEIHRAKARARAQQVGAPIPHLVATSFLTHEAIRHHLAGEGPDAMAPVHLSPGRSIGQRFIPMVRDLVSLWEETAEERLDPEKQKVRDAVRGALREWAREQGEGTDYVDNKPLQRFHPTGHWFEVPNLLRNGVLARVLEEQPRLQTLFLHNIDTVGADVDPALLGTHLESRCAMTFEVVPRRFEDRGGGLARVGGRTRLIEGLALPREEDELGLSYYNTMSTWIDIDALLECFGLSRTALAGPREVIDAAVRDMAARVPTYVTIKDVKRRWGHGQEDVFPVAQFEKLWSDMTGLPELRCGYVVVPRRRGQQLKGPEQLDAWVADGSRDHVESLCAFPTVDAAG